MLTAALDLRFAEPAAERDLRLVVEVEAAEHQRAVGLERVEAPVGEALVVGEHRAVGHVHAHRRRGVHAAGV